MKVLLVAGLLLATVYLAQAKLDEVKYIKLLEKCKGETDATEDPKVVYKTQKIPESKEGKCMMACVLESEKLMKDGKMNGAAVAEWFQTEYQDNPDQLERSASVIGKCSLQDTKGLDKCEVAYTYLKCGQDHGVKL